MYKRQLLHSQHLAHEIRHHFDVLLRQLLDRGAVHDELCLLYTSGTPFPEELHRRWHVAYAVDDLDRYADDADRIICGPMDAGPGVRLAFVEKDGAVIELYEDKN